MRKPRDFDAELDVLDQKARSLRQRKIMQLGELIISTGADRLPIDILAGALLAAVATKDAATKGAWGKTGAAMFQRRSERKAGDATALDPASSPQAAGGAQSFDLEP